MPFEAPIPKLKTALVADLFCGAGGSSTGAKRALERAGFQMSLVAVNHWPVAIQTHSINHPEARHYCADVNVAKPEELVPEGKLDLLMASPTCVFHSRARGGKPINDQGRMDPWAIVRWCTELRVKRLIVENVPEYVDWAPLNLVTGRPIKSRRGEYFRAWVRALEACGFRVEWRILTAADYGDPTTRERFFLMARSDGKRIEWPLPTHSRTGDRTLFGPTAKWRSARDHVIDWSLDGRSIFGRKKGLAPKTLDRIIAGGIKFRWPSVLIEATRAELARQLPITIARCEETIRTSKKAAQRRAAEITRAWSARRLEQLLREPPFSGGGNGSPMMVVLRNNADARSVDDPAPTVTSGGTHIALAEPYLFRMNQGLERNAGRESRSVDDPLSTITASGTDLGLVRPFMLSQHNHGAPRDIEQPVPTITTGGAANPDHPGCARPAVVEGFILNRHGENGSVRAHSTDEPMPTADCRGAGYVVEPLVMRADLQGGGGINVRSADAPLYTVTSNGGIAVVEPFIATVAHQGSDDARCRSAEEPLGTIHAGGGSHAIVEPFVLSQASGGAPRSVDEPAPTVTTGGHGGAHALVAPYYGNGSGLTCKSPDEPLDTVTAKARFALISPVTHSDGGNRARSVDEPVPTITTAHRGELALIAASFGEREGQAPRVHSVDEPAPTICAQGRVQLVEAVGFDIRFRMLEPKELARAMGFSDGDTEYEFTGTKTDRTRQIGNAVCVGQAAALVGALFRN